MHSSLSAHLVIDVTNSSLVSVHEGQNLGADEQAPLGYVFTVPGGSYEYDAWALFHSRGSNSAGAAVVGESTDLVFRRQIESRN